MNTIVALPDGKLVLTLRGVTHTVSRVEHDAHFTVTVCKVDPPNHEIEDLISSNIRANHILSQLELEQALKRIK